jgi:hypothetical protein
MGKWGDHNELLKVIGPDNPVISVVYVYKNYLLVKPDWKSFKYRNTPWGDATTLGIAIAMKDPKELIDTLETATYESEFVDARICIEQIIDPRNPLRFLGVSMREKSCMFDDNKSVVDRTMQLNAKLHMYHFMLAFHHVRETIAEETQDFYFLPEYDNPAIILSIHWGSIQKKERQKYGSTY